MTYGELIEKLKPYADKEIFFTGYELFETTRVDFSAGDEFLFTIARRWGKDEVQLIEL